ncbi:MAG TPA: restriction endonuclease subunit S [bacterium]|nr:restriction endonuclease subunit S [bacterium]
MIKEMKKWESLPILEVCEFDKGTEPGSESYNRDGLGVPFIRVGNIGAKIQEQIYTTSENVKLCKKDDILIALDGSPGIVIKGIEGAYSSGIRKIIVKGMSKVIKEFVYYYLRTDEVQKIINEHTTGVTIKHAGKSLNFIDIPIPPLSVQQKIVEVLDTVQEVIKIQEKIIETTKELKKSLMAELFKYGLPAFRKNRKLKKTEIGEIPEDWKVVRIIDLFEVKTGSTPSTKDKKYWEAGNINWITPTDLGRISETKYINGSERKITKKALREVNLNLLPKNSIVISTRAPVGYVAIISDESTFNQGCKGLMPVHTDLIPEFYYYYLIHKREILQALSSGSTFRELSKDLLETFPIPLPSLPEQKEIANMLSAVDEKIEIEKKKKELYEELFKSLLNKIMSGEIDIEKL